MFDANANPALNYGVIGRVIGHKVTHGFDDQDRELDAEEKLGDWWAGDHAKAFEAGAVLGAQYSNTSRCPTRK